VNLAAVVQDTLQHCTLVMSTNPHSHSEWILDSGATSHIVSNKELFMQYIPFTIPASLQMGNNSTAQIAGFGDIPISFQIGNLIQPATLHNVLHIPAISSNLILTSRLDNLGASVLTKNGVMTVSKDNQVIMEAELKGSLYMVKLAGDEVQSVHTAMAAKEGASPDLWHQCLSHLNHNTVKMLLMKGLVEGLAVNDNSPPHFCKACVKGKSHRHPFPVGQATHAKCHLELIHSNICGEITPNTVSGYKYFISFIDDYSCYTWVKLLHKKSEAFEAFKEFKVRVENETGEKISTLRSDNRGKYIDSTFNNFLKLFSIHHQYTTPYTPQQNGVAERFNKTIMEVVQTMLYDMEMAREFWGEGVMMAIYTRNWSPSCSIDNVTPYSLYKLHTLDISHLRVFGSTAYALVLSPCTKLEPKMRTCLLLGYDKHSKGYKLVDVNTMDIVRSRNVTFIEDCKPAPAIIDDGLPFNPTTVSKPAPLPPL
jgi:hypothetical protein